MTGPGVTATNAKLENLIKVADRIAAECGLGLAARETIEEARRAFWAALTMERGEWLLLATRPARSAAEKGPKGSSDTHRGGGMKTYQLGQADIDEAMLLLAEKRGWAGAKMTVRWRLDVNAESGETKLNHVEVDVDDGPAPTMWWKDINGHPTVRPALEAWRTMRLRVQTMERAERCDAEVLAAAKLAATEAERAYDTAVGMLLSEGAGR